MCIITESWSCNGRVTPIWESCGGVSYGEVDEENGRTAVIGIFQLDSKFLIFYIEIISTKKRKPKVQRTCFSI